MDFELSEDERSIRDVFGDFLAKESPVERVRAAEPLGFDLELWHAACETGIPLMGTPVEHGGGGASMVQLALVAMEAGRRLAPVPLVEAAVAARVLGSTVSGRNLLHGIGSGEVVPTLALQLPEDGVARLVPAGAVADVVVAIDGDDLVAVHGAETGPSPVAGNLAGAPMADRAVDRDTGTVEVLASGPRAHELYDSALDEWRMLTAALLSGLQAEALAIGVAYVKQRKVFGVELGWFQAIQHRLADQATLGAGLELLVLESAWAAENDHGRFPMLATMAFLSGAEIAFRTCRESLQFHGGYGFTLEYDIQLYFRRAKAWPLAAGPVHHGYQLLAAQAFPPDQGGLDG